MLIKKLVGNVIMMGLLSMALLVQPTQAFADRGHGGGARGWHDGGGHGGWHGSWGHGRGWGWGPVVGIAALGATATAMWIADHQYYYDDGLYYDYTPQGYVVVTPPVIVENQGYVVTQQYDATQGQVSGDIFSVNVPNLRGGYTKVVIKRSGNGFVGPQGEFYPEFPKVSQLQLMYGK
jgi:hypothetical protein